MNDGGDEEMEEANSSCGQIACDAVKYQKKKKKVQHGSVVLD